MEIISFVVGIAKHDVPRRALDAPRLTLDDLAEAVGITRGAAEPYRELRRRMPRRIRLRLAAYLEAHAAKMHDLAEELRSEDDGS
jgi:hypothetical protein